MRIRFRSALFVVLGGLAVLVAAPASSVVLELELDPAASSIGGAPATGTIQIVVPAPLPLAGAGVFDLTSLSISGSGVTATLDPDLALPGRGVLQPDGGFLIPTLHLVLSEGGALSRFVLTDLVGSLRPGGNACAFTYCLDTSFSVLTGEGVVDVAIAAVPEPGTALLVGLGLFGLARSIRGAGGCRPGEETNR